MPSALQNPQLLKFAGQKVTVVVYMLSSDRGEHIRATEDRSAFSSHQESRIGG